MFTYCAIRACACVFVCTYYELIMYIFIFSDKCVSLWVCVLAFMRICAFICVRISVWMRMCVPYKTLHAFEYTIVWRWCVNRILALCIYISKVDSLQKLILVFEACNCFMLRSETAWLHCHKKSIRVHGQESSTDSDPTAAVWYCRDQLPRNHASPFLLSYLQKLAIKFTVQSTSFIYRCTSYIMYNCKWEAAISRTILLFFSAFTFHV